MRKLFILLIILFSFSQLFSQSDNDNSDDNHVAAPPQIYNTRIGASASTLSGIGFSYERLLLPLPLAIKVTGVIYASLGDDKNKSDSYYYSDVRSSTDNINFYSSIGAELQYTLLTTKITRFYVFTGLSHIYYENSQYTDEYNFPGDNYTKKEYIEIQRDWNFGLGFGMDYQIMKNVLITIDVNYYLQSAYKTYPYFPFNPNLHAADNPHSLYIGPGCGIGAYFAF